MSELTGMFQFLRQISSGMNTKRNHPDLYHKAVVTHTGLNTNDCNTKYCVQLLFAYVASFILL